MGFVIENTLIEIISALLLICWMVYTYTTQHFNYWKDRGVPYKTPVFPYGSTKDTFMTLKQVGEMYDDFYKEFESAPYFGVLEGRTPNLVVKDPELLKHILIKDFQHFSDRFSVFPIDSKKDYLLRHLFHMTGKEWRQMRLKLTPTFTSGKMKAMFFLMAKCTEQMGEFVEKEIQENPVVHIKDLLARFTMDVIATCAFGLEINSLSDKECEFYKMAMKINDPPNFLQLVMFSVITAFPFMAKVYTPRFLAEDLNKFITNIVKDTTKYREENNVSRKDFLDLLIKIRQNKSLTEEEEEGQTTGQLSSEQKSSNKEGLTIKEMAAQVFVFLAAGFETASSTMAFCLYELARNPEVQDKLYREIKQVLSKHNGELTYQAVQDMTYMDQVVNETLRRYASVPVLVRACTVPYKLPDSNLILEKDTRIIIPAFSLHHDPKYYPEPLKFDPDRFAPDKVKERPACLHIPFGEGPRMCIGMRFGLLQTKLGLTEMVSKFLFKVTPETQIPVVLHKASFTTMPEKPIMLHLTKREAAF